MLYSFFSIEHYNQKYRRKFISNSFVRFKWLYILSFKCMWHSLKPELPMSINIGKLQKVKMLFTIQKCTFAINVEKLDYEVQTMIIHDGYTFIPFTNLFHFVIYCLFRFVNFLLFRYISVFRSMENNSMIRCVFNMRCIWS